MAKDIIIVGIVNALLQGGKQFPIQGSGQVLNGMGKGHVDFPECFPRSL
jgi:hypothetical protein